MFSRYVLPLLCCVACHDPATLDTKVPVHGMSLHLLCRGEGSPTVVFESGLGNDARAWSKVQPEIAKLTRACAYDRAGLGSSSPAPRPHSNRDMVSELHGLLDAASIPPPYVLAGHSMGGTNAQLFLAEYPSAVAGMVLVDASPLPPPFDDFPKDTLAEFEHNIGKLEGLDISTMLKGFDELKDTPRALNHKPLVILIAGQPQPEPFLSAERAQENFIARQKAQNELANMSSNSVVVTVRNSSHHIPLESPAEVVKAVTAVVKAARGHSRLSEASLQ